MPFIVIAATRHVNKNVSTGAVIRAKPGTELGVHNLLANYQTGFGYKFRPANGWYVIRFFWVEFMNVPKLNRGNYFSIISKNIYNSNTRFSYVQNIMK